MDSPALSVRSDFSDMDDEQLDLYLATCVPLSSLPTPPPAKQQQPLPIPAPLPSPPAEESLPYTHELEVYATHLAKLVPRNVSAQNPDVGAIHGFLERAGLPTEVVAFAACVLDTMTSRFASSWRDAMLPMNESKLDFYLGRNCWQRPSVSPDLIVLASLALAHGFLEDQGRSNSHWAQVEAQKRFSAHQVQRTKMCILEDMDYGLFKIGEEMVKRMVRDMRRACSFEFPVYSHTRVDSAHMDKEEQRPKLALSTSPSGTAIWTYGVQTPEPSP